VSGQDIVARFEIQECDTELQLAQVGGDFCNIPEPLACSDIDTQAARSTSLPLVLIPSMNLEKLGLEKEEGNITWKR
jgi:hypothetical protein